MKRNTPSVRRVEVSSIRKDAPMAKVTITTLFLDIGGVLLTNGWDRAMRKKAAKTFRLDEEEMNERHHLTFDIYEQGKLTLDDYLDRVVFYRQQPFPREEFKEFMFAQSRPYPEMIELFRRLKSRHGLKIAAVNNEGRELNEFRIREFGLGSCVDFFISSCYVHFRKPDKDIYRIALDIAQTSTEQVVYFDDRPIFVEVAASMGIRGIVHSGYQTTLAALKKLGLKADT